MKNKSPLTIAFGKGVRKKRLSLNMTIEYLAEKADLHPNYVGSIERGERNLSLRNIYKLARGLNTHPKDMLP